MISFVIPPNIYSYLSFERYVVICKMMYLHEYAKILSLNFCITPQPQCQNQNATVPNDNHRKEINWKCNLYITTPMPGLANNCEISNWRLITNPSTFWNVNPQSFLNLTILLASNAMITVMHDLSWYKMWWYNAIVQCLYHDITMEFNNLHI